MNHCVRRIGYGGRGLLARGVAMVVVRFVGWLLIIAALAVLLNEAWGWYRNGQWATISAGKLWFDLHRDSLLLAQPAIERHVARSLWSPVIATLLQWPAWAVLGGPRVGRALI